MKKSKKNNRNFVCYSTPISQQDDPVETSPASVSYSDSDSLYYNSSDKSSKEDEVTDSDENHSQLSKQLEILAFESSEDETITDDEDDAFSSFPKLCLVTNSAHLAVFINFTIVHSMSEPILFYLISTLYENGNVMDMKKWAYEIYSSFLAPFSPLKILNAAEHDALFKDIEMKLVQLSSYEPTVDSMSAYNFEMNRLLREIFSKSRKEVLKTLIKQLAEFQNKRKAGLETMYGASSADLKTAKKDKMIQQKIIEKNLMPKLLQMLEDLEENKENFSKMILVSALSTVIHKVFNPPTTYCEPVNQFISQANQTNKSKMSKMGHRMMPKTCYAPTYCDFCSKVLWGLASQGFECDCGIIIHKSCMEKLQGKCLLHKDEKESDFEIDGSEDMTAILKLVHKTIGIHNIENYKRNKANRPKSDPGLYNISNQTTLLESSDESDLDQTIWSNDGLSEIKLLSDRERKLKEVTMELLETERRHVKILHVLQNVFFEPLKRNKSLSTDLINMLFPQSFFIIKDWHDTFEKMLKKEWEEQQGNLLEIGNCLSIFEKPYGNILKENAAKFCSVQTKGLEMLRIARCKNEFLQRALIKAESHTRCKRLQLKDLMLSILQRITKYPLLFERILKYSHGIEHDKVKGAYESSKMILTYVNDAVRNFEELQSIQMRLDKSYFVKDFPVEFRDINLCDYQLSFDGYAAMKKCPSSLRVLLFEKILVILRRQDDKYLLKSCENMKHPIVKLHTTIIRSNAIDQKSFFLISQTENDSQMLELTLPTESECQRWMQHISRAIDKSKEHMALKRKPSAESAQSMLRHESKINLPIKKQSELVTISQALATQATHIEEWITEAQKSMKADLWNREGRDGDSISACLSTFNCLISQLTIKIAERDHEREFLLKENQQLKEQKKS